MKKIISAILLSSVAGSIFITGMAIDKEFIDVPENSWFSDSVSSLAEKNIIQGYGDGTFKPEQLINRAESAAILDRFILYKEEGEIPAKNSDPLAEVQDITIPAQIDLNVPFTSQAPNGNWAMPYAEACEEASLIMVKYFWDKKELTANLADSEIVNMVKWEGEHSMGVDVDAAETRQIAIEYLGMNAFSYYDENVTLDNIKKLIGGGYPVIIPAAGQILDNPNYRGDGPPYHMIVLSGFNTQGFISNDPGTRFGESYIYTYDTIENAIHDWTGAKSTVREGRRAMVVLSPL